MDLSAQRIVFGGLFTSSGRMVSPGPADTITTLQKGRANLEVADIPPENNLRIGVNNSSTRLSKTGLYDFADRGVIRVFNIRVFDGKAEVQVAGQRIEVKGGHQLALNAKGKLKAGKFDKKAYTVDFYVGRACNPRT